MFRSRNPPHPPPSPPSAPPCGPLCIAGHAVAAGPVSYALEGLFLTVEGLQLSRYDMYALRPWNSSCSAAAGGRLVLRTGAATAAAVRVAIPPGQHSVCYCHRPTASAPVHWRPLAPALEVMGAAKWVPSVRTPRPFQQFLAMVRGHGLSVRDLYFVVSAAGAARRSAGCAQPNASPLQVSANMVLNSTAVQLPLMLGGGTFCLCYFVPQSGWQQVPLLCCHRHRLQLLLLPLLPLPATATAAAMATAAAAASAMDRCCVFTPPLP